jgi:hypothetical protein
MFLCSVDPFEVGWPVDSVELIGTNHLPIDVMMRHQPLTDGTWSFTHNRCHVGTWRTIWLG